jgi:hypothetical protein
VRCGKSNCRCATGEPHRAFYRFWTEDGRQRKAYVRRADLGARTKPCARWREADAVKAAILASPRAAEVRAGMRATLREAMGSQIETPEGRRQLRRLR